MKQLLGLASASVLLLSGQGAMAQHIHAGALSTNQGGQLYFSDGAFFASTSGYVKPLIYTNAGTYAGYFQGNITFVASSGVATNAEFNSNAPAFGSFIDMRIESATGPAGGSFQFWENGALSPTTSLNIGDTNGSFLFALSDLTLGAGTPGGDPFGHLHGRRFTATVAGDYTIGVRLFDVSTNGFGGGPIQSMSELLYVNFSAVPEPTVVALGVVGMAGLAGLMRRRSAKP